MGATWAPSVRRDVFRRRVRGECSRSCIQYVHDPRTERRMSPFLGAPFRGTSCTPTAMYGVWALPKTLATAQLRRRTRLLGNLIVI